MTTQSNTNYFNNAVSGAFYLNEIKRISPKKGDDFIAIKATLLDGKVESPDYQSVDLIVKGSEAKQIIESFENQWPSYQQKDKATVFANLRIGSIGVKPFLNKKGEPDAVMSGRLIKINYLKLNDQVIKKSEPQAVKVTDNNDDKVAESTKNVNTQNYENSPMYSNNFGGFSMQYS